MRNCKISFFRFLPAIFLLALSASGCMTLLGRPSLFLTPAERIPKLRYASRQDLRIPEGPFTLDVVFTIHPQIRLEPISSGWRGDVPQAELSSLDDFRSLTRNVLSQGFRSAVEIEAGAHIRIGELKRMLLERGSPVEDLPSLNAKALLLVDFLPARKVFPLRRGSQPVAQLSVKMYDISYRHYEEMMLFNPRLLIFEDFAEIAMPGDPSHCSGSYLLAWREIFSRMRSSDRVQKFLKLENEPLDETRMEGAILLGIIPQKKIPRFADPRSHEWIEQEILFPPAVIRDSQGEVPPGNQEGTKGEALPAESREDAQNGQPPIQSPPESKAVLESGLGSYPPLGSIQGIPPTEFPGVLEADPESIPPLKETVEEIRGQDEEL